jgi:ATP synthase protein I
LRKRAARCFLDIVSFSFLSSLSSCTAERVWVETEAAMGEQSPDERLSEFKARLDRLKDGDSTQVVPKSGQMQSGYGMAFAITADLVGGLVGGAAIGWFFDRWLGSAPWGLIAFFFLGAAAGMWNVYRTVRGYDMSFGFGRPPTGRAAHGDETNTPAGARSENEVGDHRGQSTPPV